MKICVNPHHVRHLFTFILNVFLFIHSSLPAEKINSVVSGPPHSSVIWVRLRKPQYIADINHKIKQIKLEFCRQQLLTAEVSCNRHN